MDSIVTSFLTKALLILFLLPVLQGNRKVAHLSEKKRLQAMRKMYDPEDLALFVNRTSSSLPSESWAQGGARTRQCALNRIEPLCRVSHSDWTMGKSLHEEKQRLSFFKIFSRMTPFLWLLRHRQGSVGISHIASSFLTLHTKENFQPIPQKCSEEEKESSAFRSLRRFQVNRRSNLDDAVQPCISAYKNSLHNSISKLVLNANKIKTYFSLSFPNPMPAPPTPLPQVYYTGVPTPAPHTQAPVPTVAPIRRPLPIVSTSTTKLTTQYLVPTLGPTFPSRPPFINNSMSSTWHTTQQPHVFASTLRAIVSSTATVCVQYVNVQHNLDCGGRSKRQVPSTEKLTALLEHYGASPLSPFTAPTFHHAVDTFRNLLPLDSSDMGDDVLLKLRTHQLQHLVDHYSRTHFDQHSSSEAPSYSLQHLYAKILHKIVPAQYLIRNVRDRRNIFQDDTRNFTCLTSVQCRDLEASVCASGELETIIDNSGCETCQCRRTGFLSSYCQAVDDHSESGIYTRRLCTACQQIRYLGPQYFPSFVQEVVCSSGSISCLNLANLGPQGQCQVTRIPVTVLHKRPGRCMRVQLTNGQDLLLDDWQVSQIFLRTGCQCVLDRRGQIAASLDSK